MIELFREAGFPIIPVTLFGTLTLLSALMLCLKGDRRRLHFIVAMGAATLAAVACATCADLAAVGHRAPTLCKQLGLALPECLLQGMAESMAPGVLGFSLLALAGMATAIGLVRTRAEAGIA